MFRKKWHKTERRRALNQLSDKVAGRIAGRVAGLQHALAGFMNRKTSRISAAGWKMVVIAFAAVGGTLNIYFMVSAFTSKAVNRTNRPAFIVNQPRKDSLAIIEMIYGESRKNQQKKLNNE